MFCGHQALERDLADSRLANSKGGGKRCGAGEGQQSPSLASSSSSLTPGGAADDLAPFKVELSRGQAR